MSIIEALKNKKEIYYYWTGEEKKEADRIGMANFREFKGDAYYLPSTSWFRDDKNYRLHGIYQEEKP